MRIRINKKCLTLLVSLGLVAVCAVSALAVSAVPVKSSSSLGGYTLQKTEESSADTVSLRYKNAANGQILVTYTTKGSAAQRLGLRQYSTEPLLYACYSDDFDTANIGVVYFTIGNCTVTVRSMSSAGTAVRLTKSDMLDFITQVQSSPVPVAVGVCAKCGGDLYNNGATVSAWKKVSTSACSHGGGLKYSDTKKERTVTTKTVCADCGNTTTDTQTQTGTYCSYAERWYMK
jgi:hypothetical protein